MAKKLLIVIDMQNDFVHNTDVLGSEAAQAIIPNVKAKIDEYLNNGGQVIFTRDTHNPTYLKTQEGEMLPVPHCIHGTTGWCVIDELEHPECPHYDKHSFGYAYWDRHCTFEDDYQSIELCGVCTDICVVSNVLILKSVYHEIPIIVDSKCCAGVTPAKHEAALEVMRSCQIEVI